MENIDLTERQLFSPKPILWVDAIRYEREFSSHNVLGSQQDRLFSILNFMAQEPCILRNQMDEDQERHYYIFPDDYPDMWADMIDDNCTRCGCYLHGLNIDLKYKMLCQNCEGGVTTNHIGRNGPLDGSFAKMHDTDYQD